MYYHAGGKAYYTTPTPSDSIAYDGNDLVIKVAFQNQGSAGTFINNINELNPEFGGPVVQMVESRPYHGSLDMSNLVLEQHYRASDTSSPAGSRDSASSTGSSFVIPVHKKTMLIQHQCLQDARLVASAGFEMAHIKPRCSCTDSEKKDINNLLAMTPDLHSMFDGRMSIPKVLIEFMEADESDFTTITLPNGVAANIYKVMLRVTYYDEDARDASSVQFKAGTISSEDGMTHRVVVGVRNIAKFRAFIDFKVDATRDSWNP